jgi:serine phosphatase RsbU (regulator of sigma subunit)
MNFSLRTALLICFYMALFRGFAQNDHYMDGLRRVISTLKDTDTNKAFAMSKLAFEYSYIDLDSGMRIAEKALSLAENTNYNHGKAHAYNTMGTICHDKGDFQKAVECFSKARMYAERTNDRSMLAVIYGNMGNTYEFVKDYASAKHYLFASMRLFKELKQPEKHAGSYMNIGVMYFDHNELDSAMYYYRESLKLPFGDVGQASILRFNISECYLKQNNLAGAEKELLIGMDLIKELNSDYYDAMFSQQLGKIYILQKKYDEAEKLILKSLNVAQRSKLLNPETQAHYKMYELYEAKKEYQKALQYHIRYMQLNDSLNNMERGNAAKELEKKYQTEKKQAEIVKLNAENIISESESKRKSQLLIFAFIGVGLVLCALGFAVFAFINKRKANVKLEVLNKEVLLQKEELQDKNKSITDSIQYAQRIQNVLLTSQSYIRENLSNFFILNKPKDIVSGDFYWAIRQDDHFYFMVADCTGHGVPGAFMSLLGINFLNEIVLERKIQSPEKILDNLRAEIINVFTDKGKTESEISDGMDCVLCRFDLKTNLLHYAAANNAIMLIRHGALMELNGDKMPVGKSPRDQEPFTLQTFQLEPGDCLYMTTDGYPDQFGGKQGKKLKMKEVKQLLLSYTAQPVEEQKQALNRYFESWKGNLEQLDDVLMVGVKI